jgi:hypothetical protein
VSEETLKEKALWQEALAFWPLVLAVAATSVFGWYTIHLAQEVTTMDEVTASRFEHFIAGRPNEMGDTLAGFVGSLTLIWVVASVLQQSMELRAQRREFAEMVRAQDAQVSALQAQARIFEDEKASRDEQKAGEVFDELLDKLRLEMKETAEFGLYWEYPSPEGADPSTITLLFDPHYSPFSGFSHNETVKDNYFLLAEKDLRYKSERALSAISKGFPPIERHNRPRVFDDILITLEYLIELKDRLSESEQIRFSRYRLAEIDQGVRSVLADKSLWVEETT